MENSHMTRSPLDVLANEHRCIQRVVSALALHADAIESGSPPDLRMLGDVVGFMRAYADEVHHGKEESLLFPALERRGVPSGGCPLGALMHEHIAGRALVAELAAAVSSCCADTAIGNEALVRCLQGLVALYPSHIWKEDYLLFPMAGKVLQEDDLSRMNAEFDGLDTAFGVERLRGFEEWADALVADTMGP